MAASNEDAEEDLVGIKKENPAVGVWLGGVVKVTCMVPLGDDCQVWM
jgi:hypothetical protein